VIGGHRGAQSADSREPYPNGALQLWLRHLVILDLIIGHEGTVTDVKVLRGHALLNQAAIDRCAEAYPVIQDVNHPNVKICFDLYHLQRTEGNLIVNLRRGLEDKLIKIVQIGDNPGRLEPGTGEINYPFVFKELRRLG
jgi:sugar phosphate isomerase/epimerase